MSGESVEKPHLCDDCAALSIAAVVMALEKPILDAWSAFMNGPGGKTESLRQGKHEGLDRGRRIAVDALRSLTLPPGKPTGADQ